MLVRVCVVTGALVMAAWFGLGWVQSRDTGRAQSLVQASSLSPQQAANAASLLNSAGTLNPDRTVDILRSQLADDEHHFVTAVSIMEPVVRAEPLNVFAWKQLVHAASKAGHGRMAEAAALRLFALVAEPK